MQYQITYRTAHADARANLFLDADDAATAVIAAQQFVTSQGSAFELLSVIPQPILVPKASRTVGPPAGP